MVEIKCHKLGRSYERSHFFILNKGDNSGKPMETPCPNCFVIQTEDRQERDFYFWLLFGLWKSKYFHLILRGSVIPFVSIREFKKVLFSEAEKAKTKLPEFHLVVKNLIALDKYEENSRKTINLVRIAKIQIFNSYRKSI